MLNSVNKMTSALQLVSTSGDDEIYSNYYYIYIYIYIYTYFYDYDGDDDPDDEDPLSYSIREASMFPRTTRR
ncbi:hypothetical protein PC120_g22295 [Phytophthora cactorum]|nr:hypothetical protein PC120_g22295 [Phytophthora cactorum]